MATKSSDTRGVSHDSETDIRWAGSTEKVDLTESICAKSEFALKCATKKDGALFVSLSGMHDWRNSVVDDAGGKSQAKLLTSSIFEIVKAGCPSDLRTKIRPPLVQMNLIPTVRARDLVAPSKLY